MTTSWINICQWRLLISSHNNLCFVWLCLTNVFFVIWNPLWDKPLFPLVLFQGQPENKLKFFSSNKTDIKHVLCRYNGRKNDAIYRTIHIILYMCVCLPLQSLRLRKYFSIMVRARDHVIIFIFVKSQQYLTGQANGKS